jgi:hypothetical protein
MAAIVIWTSLNVSHQIPIRRPGLCVVETIGHDARLFSVPPRECFQPDPCFQVTSCAAELGVNHTSKAGIFEAVERAQSRFELNEKRRFPIMNA